MADKFTRRLSAPKVPYESSEIYDPEVEDKTPGFLEFITNGLDSLSGSAPLRAAVDAKLTGKAAGDAAFEAFGDSRKAPSGKDILVHAGVSDKPFKWNLTDPTEGGFQRWKNGETAGKASLAEVAGPAVDMALDPALILTGLEKLGGKTVVPAIERIAELQKGPRALAGELKLGEAEAKGLKAFEKAHGIGQDAASIKDPIEVKTFDDLITNLENGHNVQIPKQFIDRVGEIDENFANALRNVKDEDEKLQLLKDINGEGFYSGESVTDTPKPKNKEEALRLKRAKEMGFDTDKVYYHGTKGDIKEFSTDALGASTNAGSAKKGFFFASDPSTAADYSELSGSRALLRNQDLANKLKTEEIRLIDRYGEDWKKTAPKENLKKYTDLMAQYDGTFDEAFKDYTKEIRSREENLREWKGKYDTKSQKKWLQSAKQNKQYFEDILSGKKEVAYKMPDSYYKEKLDRINRLIKESKDSLSLEAQASAKEGIDATESEIKKLKARHEEEGKLGSNVIPVRLKTQNPYIHDFKGAPYRDSPYSEIMTKARLNGHDSVIFKNTYDPADPYNRVMQDIVTVFEPNQIRSVNAAFNPKNAGSANILAGGAGLGLLNLIKEE